MLMYMYQLYICFALLCWRKYRIYLSISIYILNENVIFSFDLKLRKQFVFT